MRTVELRGPAAEVADPGIRRTPKGAVTSHGQGRATVTGTASTEVDRGVATARSGVAVIGAVAKKSATSDGRGRATERRTETATTATSCAATRNIGKSTRKTDLAAEAAAQGDEGRTK